VFGHPVDVSGWHLLSNRVTLASGGRIFGQGTVFAADGNAVAGFSQWAMIRPMPAAAQGTGFRSAM
jgi:acyl-CoA thioesterase